LFVAGGGVRNPTLMRRIRALTGARPPARSHPVSRSLPR